MSSQYTQDSIVDFFSHKFEVDGGFCVQHIKTAISNVFVFSNSVYKIYKNDNKFYNENFKDISIKEVRFNFSEKDFAWNKRMAPEIYLNIRGCCFRDDKLVFVKKEAADELIIEMKKIDTNSVLLLKLLDNNISKDEIESIGFQLHKSLDSLPEVYDKKKLKDAIQLRISDVKSWVLSVPQYIDKKEGEVFLEFLDKKILSYMNDISDFEMAKPNIDGHSENLFFDKGILYIMDSYSPKEEWLLADGNLNFYRLATDILALGNDELFEAFKAGYNKYEGKYTIDEKQESFYIYYSSMIMLPYLYMLGEHDKRRMKAAKIYHNFVREIIK